MWLWSAGVSGRFGAGCDRHGSLHSAARIRSGHGQPCRRLHGDTRGQIPQEVCSYRGWCVRAVKLLKSEMMLYLWQLRL